QRRGVHPRPLEDAGPLEQLRRAGGAVPGAALGALGLELQQITAERALQAGQGRLRAVGRAVERGLPASGCRGRRVAAGPALEQPAEGERSDLARAELPDQALRGVDVRRASDEDVRPGAVGLEPAHTSTTTGKI